MERRRFLATSVTVTAGVFAGCGNPGDDEEGDGEGENGGGEGEEDGEEEGGYG